MSGAQFATETYRTGFQKKDHGEDGDLKEIIFVFETFCHKPSILSGYIFLQCLRGFRLFLVVPTQPSFEGFKFS